MNDKHGKPLIGFAHAWYGVKKAINSERNLRLHVLASICVIAGGIIFRLSIIEWTVIILAIGLVLVAEFLNTAIEKMIDYVKPDIHPRAKEIKDIAAGAVLIASVIAAAVGVLIFIPEFSRFFNGF